MTSFKISFGGIITVICIAIIIWLMSTFYKIASSDPWPQLIIVPFCYVPPFVVGTILGIFLLINGIKSINNKSSIKQPTQELPKGEEEKLTDEQVERQRVEKYGVEVVVCSSCGTINSLSFSYCQNCSKDLSKEKAISNPYL